MHPHSPRKARLNPHPEMVTLDPPLKVVKPSSCWAPPPQQTFCAGLFEEKVYPIKQGIKGGHLKPLQNEFLYFS